jgi:hypothetical protein
MASPGGLLTLFAMLPAKAFRNLPPGWKVGVGDGKKLPKPEGGSRMLT